MPLSTGEILESRYRIVSLLGQGGMGAVYKAWDMRLEKPVAIKENLDASKESQKQFSREAKILAQLDHPNLPNVADFFSVPERGQYLVMDYVEGEDLQVKLNRAHKPLDEEDVLFWVLQIWVLSLI
ncbi:MAG: protein kinase [Chloroflexota bacterium]